MQKLALKSKPAIRRRDVLTKFSEKIQSHNIHHLIRQIGFKKKSKKNFGLNLVKVSRHGCKNGLYTTNNLKLVRKIRCSNIFMEI